MEWPRCGQTIQFNGRSMNFIVIKANRLRTFEQRKQYLPQWGDQQ